MVDSRVNELLDELIRNWSGWETSRFYVDELVPAIVRGDRCVANLMPSEQRVVEKLRALLNSEQWRELPRLVEDRQASLVVEKEHKQVGLARQKDQQQEERRRWIEEKQRKNREEQLAAKQREWEVDERRRRVEELRADLRQTLDDDFLRVDDVYRAHADAALLDPSEYDDLKARFVQEWSRRTLRQELDLEQATAVATTGADVRVTARAGSGKTRTLVSRAIFLISHCRVPARNLLLLAFNRRAAEEMRERITNALDGELPHVMTFHALAYALVHPDEKIVFDDAASDSLALSRAIQDVIDAHLRNPAYIDNIRDLMLEHYREDWEAIVAGGYQFSMDDLLLRRRAAPRETLRGEYVKSHGEKVIANVLFEHGIDYAYERNRRWNGVNYRPDFTILGPRGGGGVAIEYFGLAGGLDYDEQADEKRKYWTSQHGWTLLEYRSSDIAGDIDAFTSMMLRHLQRLGIEGHHLDDEDIWELIRDRAIDRFTAAVKTFVGRCRKQGLSPDDIANRVRAHSAATSSETAFLRIAESVHRGYLTSLIDAGQEDFDGLMWRAGALLKQGVTRFARAGGRERGDLAAVQYVHVDEFQDFSQMFVEITSGIRRASPHVEYFCVGDDWQAINAFAGSELRFFTDFGAYFESGITHEIRTNYRSPSTVVEVGNAVMSGRGPAARPHRADKGVVWRCDLDRFQPTAAEEQRHNGDDVTPVVLRLVQYFLNCDQAVVLLARRNGIPWYVNYKATRKGSPDALERFLAEVRAYLPEEDRRRVTISTAHKYKGLEKDAVIVLDALDDSYPLIHPSWVFLRIFGDSPEKIEAEERRLFYVALTRATQSLVLLTEERRATPYLRDIQALVALQSAPWPNLQPVSSPHDPRVEIRVFEAYEVREHLKRSGFRWSQERKCWWRTIPSEQYSEAVLLAKEWFTGKAEVEVCSDTGLVIRRRSTRHSSL